MLKAGPTGGLHCLTRPREASLVLSRLGYPILGTSGPMHDNGGYVNSQEDSVKIPLSSGQRHPLDSQYGADRTSGEQSRDDAAAQREQRDRSSSQDDDLPGLRERQGQRDR